MFETVIPIRCIPKARPRVRRKGWTFMPTEYKDWLTSVAVHLRALHPPCLAIPCCVIATIRIKSAQHGDIDNLIGALLDAAKGILFTDDRLIHELHVLLQLKQPADEIHLRVWAK